MKSAPSVMLSIVLLVSSAVHAQEQPTIELGFRDFLFDFFVGEVLGGQEASPDIQEYARKILKEVNVRNADSVRIRKIAKKGIFEFFKTANNACACDILFFPKYMYISESFFRDLTDEQRRFLIGHEAMHLKYRHTILSPIAYISLGLLISSLTGKKTGGFSALVLRSIISKCCELHADRCSALQLNTIDGGVGLMNYFIDYEKECEQELPQWQANRLLRSVVKLGYTIKRFFVGSHPACKTRIAWLESLRTT